MKDNKKNNKRYYFTFDKEYQNLNRFNECNTEQQKLSLIKTLTTQQSIILYKDIQDSNLRDILYQKNIYIPLLRLAQYSVNRRSVFNYQLHTDNIYYDIVSYLTTRLDKYSKTKGRALSYFTTIADNYLLLFRINATKYNNNISVIVDGQDNESFVYCYQHDTQSQALSTNQLQDLNHIVFYKDILKDVVLYCNLNMDKLFRGQIQQMLAPKVLQFLSQYTKYIENYRQRDIYNSLKDYVEAPSSKLTHVLRRIKQIYYVFKSNKIEQIQNIERYIFSEQQ